MKDFYLLFMVFGVIVCLPYRLMISTMIMPIASLRVRKFSLEGAKAGVGRGLAASEHARGGTGDDVAACFDELLKPGKLSHRYAEFTLVHPSPGIVIGIIPYLLHSVTLND